jgi:vacuolar-type H+-ATPase catalytic subunit A/Vma1
LNEAVLDEALAQTSLPAYLEAAADRFGARRRDEAERHHKRVVAGKVSRLVSQRQEDGGGEPS